MLKELNIEKDLKRRKMNRLVLGLLRGDEGKGKITDYFAKQADVVIRYAGSCNAGHTLYRGDKKIVLHQIPSGILHKKECVIGRGCLVDLKKLLNEVQQLNDLIQDDQLEGFTKKDSIFDYLKISYGAHIIFQHHIQEDIEREDSGKGNGSTKCGIAPGYRDKYYRSGIRVFDLVKMIPNEVNSEKFQQLKKDIGLSTFELQTILTCAVDDELLINDMYPDEINLLFEGAQGVLLDINSPYYPNVSSSSVGIDGVIAGTGINYNKLLKDNEFKIVGVAKAYMSSVGAGKFLTQLDDENTTLIRDAGQEYGATTGRPRKVGWFDLPLLQYSIKTSGANELCITCLDTLMEAFKDVGSFKVCVAYRNKKTRNEDCVANIWELDDCEPIYETFKIWKECSMEDENFEHFIIFLQENIQIPIKYLSIGKEENDIITITKELI